MHFRGCCFGEVCAAFLAGIRIPKRTLSDRSAFFAARVTRPVHFQSWSMMIISLQAEGKHGSD